MFYRANDVAESKMVRNMLCSTIETDVVGRERDGGYGLVLRYVRARLAIFRTVMVI